MAVTGAPLDRIGFLDDRTLAWYSPDPSVAYGFCSTCGSSLFWRSTDHPEQLAICAGSLEQPTGLRTTTAWWMSEHADYHAPAPDLEEFDFDG